MITIKTSIGIPKYKQIAISIEKAIEDKIIGKGEKLPSINKVCLTHSLSRDTVLQAYDELKKRGVIYAILGKGYFIKSTEIKPKQRIFLLFDELNIFKEDLYTSFLNSVGNEAEIDLYFHHFNSQLFRKLIQESKGNYTQYVIMPTNLAEAADIIKTLPVEEVTILDQTNSELSNYPTVYQNFVKDMYDGLLKGKEQLQKYTKLIILFPGFREPLGMKIGFEKFCQEHHFEYEVRSEFTNEKVESGTVYIIPNDRDLVRVIEQAKLQQLQLGLDYGIISYNETPLKKLVENGITTISTDFQAMGKTLAEMILKYKKTQIVLGVLVAMLTINTLTTLYKLRPYEYIYYNHFAGSNFKEAEHKWESDYWSSSLIETTQMLEDYLDKEEAQAPTKDRKAHYLVAVCAEAFQGDAYFDERLSVTEDWVIADFFISGTNMNCDKVLQGKMVGTVERLGTTLAVVKDRRQLVGEDRRPRAAPRD